MLSPLTEEQLDRLDPDVRELLQKYFNDQSSLESELKTKYERLRVDSGEPAERVPRIANVVKIRRTEKYCAVSLGFIFRLASGPEIFHFSNFLELVVLGPLSSVQ
jgi:hypothetical protein